MRKGPVLSVPVYTAIVSLALPQSDMQLFAGAPVHGGKGSAKTFRDCWMKGLKPGELKLQHLQWGACGGQVRNGAPAQVHLTADPRTRPVVISVAPYCVLGLARPVLEVLSWIPPLVEKEPLVGKVKWNYPLLVKTVNLTLACGYFPSDLPGQTLLVPSCSLASNWCDFSTNVLVVKICGP